MSDSDYLLAIAEIGSISWRFAQDYRRLISRLSPAEQSRFENKCIYFQRQLEKSLSAVGLNCVNLEGQVYAIGMAASVLNLDDFSEGTDLTIDQMIEPLIMDTDGSVIRTGKAMVKSAGAMG